MSDLFKKKIAAQDILDTRNKELGLPVSNPSATKIIIEVAKMGGAGKSMKQKKLEELRGMLEGGPGEDESTAFDDMDLDELAIDIPMAKKAIEKKKGAK